MEEIINKVQIVINTLDGGFKDLPTTYENCTKLAGCINFLVEARDALKKKEKENGHDADTD